jgi:hypothetical protein
LAVILDFFDFIPQISRQPLFSFVSPSTKFQIGWIERENQMKKSMSTGAIRLRSAKYELRKRRKKKKLTSQSVRTVWGGAAKPRQATLIRGFCLHKSGVAMAICCQSSRASSRICRDSKGPLTLIFAGKKCW